MCYCTTNRRTPRCDKIDCIPTIEESTIQAINNLNGIASKIVSNNKKIQQLIFDEYKKIQEQPGTIIPDEDYLLK